MLLSDQDIRKFLNKEIVIYPFEEKDLTPVGYNLNPGEFMYSINDGVLIQKTLNEENEEVFKIKAHDTVLILTNEAVWVSKRIAGTFHSKVGVVSKGFGHISTTLDPDWAGPLLISLNNPTNKELELPANTSFVTLIFYKTHTPAQKPHDNDPSRIDIIQAISKKILSKNIVGLNIGQLLRNKVKDELKEKQNSFLLKAQTIIGTPYAYEEFKKQYNELSSQSKKFILKGQLENNIQLLINFAKYWFVILIELFILTILLLTFISKYVYPINFLNFHILIAKIDQGTFVGLIAILIACFQITITKKQE